MTRFADVILPLPLYRYFTYRIPADMQGRLRQGHRVVVSFGRSKFYTAIVVALHDTEPQGYEVKEIATLLDDEPIVLRPQLKFWEWIAEYYLCSVGDVYKAALPSGLKLESETSLSVNSDYEESAEEPLSEREAVLMQVLSEQGRLTVHELEKLTGLRNTLPVLRRLVEREAIFVSERIRANYKPKTEVCIRLSFEPGNQEALRNAFELVKRSKQQETLLLSYLELSHFMQPGNYAEVSRTALLERAGVSAAVLAGVVNKGVMLTYKREISRFAKVMRHCADLPTLSSEQSRALNEICSAMRDKSVTLLHGVTSSGKTEIYTHLIDNALKQGRQVLYLVPEIALTTQLTDRLQRVFGDKLLIYHSRFSDNERVEIWQKLLTDREPKVILGVRSSIFLPFHNLGLVIVDEEHETSYKQYDPAPRYHARNAAIVLAQMYDARVLLGSATPAIESYYNAQCGKYGLVELLTRYSNNPLPEVRTIDMREQRRKKLARGNFSEPLVQEVHKALEREEQIILFQNRRGFAPMVECRECAWIPKCTQCDVSLTYHKRDNRLVCHYCGYSCEVPRMCPACLQPTIEVRGFGTERIEEDVESIFPDTPLARMDLDTTRSRNAYQEIIDNFAEGKSKILIGTQMVTKGLDFDRVSVVGILSADTMLSFPDFRAHERAFQMMAQVAGRSGRGKSRGIVFLQTSQPETPVISQVIRHDYVGMYNEQLSQREAFGYPPFTRLIYIYLKHRDEAVLDTLSQQYATILRKVFGERVLGPDNPPVARIQSLYIRKIMLKVEVSASMAQVKDLLRQIYERSLADDRFKALTLYYDVDPM
ncbi:MAG: primosomal protein N' [Bacteroidaceae bacterium]|nr:primosomal protein N' [Bacteroidaceae bacterium]